MKLILTVLLTVSAARAGPSRVDFADQSNFNAKLGFVLDLEGDSGSAPACDLGTMRLVVGFADGSTWRYVVGPQPLQSGSTYTLQATVGKTGAELFLNGASLGKMGGSFSPANVPLLLN